MIRKPTSADPEQREHESERARKSSQLSAAGGSQVDETVRRNEKSHRAARPMHGSSDGESAHGAIPREGIEYEHGD